MIDKENGNKSIKYRGGYFIAVKTYSMTFWEHLNFD